MIYESEASDITFIKNHYYPGKLLCASDFLREQEYGNRKLEFINRKFHGCGIIEGLDVRAEEDGTLHISQGSAIDPCGRILIVPSETTVNARKLEGMTERDFILGIRYAERTIDWETSYLEPEKPSRGARLEEAFALKAYTWEEWKSLKASENEGMRMLTEEKVLFRDGHVRLVVMAPRAVPSDSIFKCRIQARVHPGDTGGIKWSCTARLQGAFFAESGQAVRRLEGEENLLSGTVMREWEICTEENRKLPVTLELTHLKIKSGNTAEKELETCQLQIQTAPSYEDIVKEYLWRKNKRPAGKRQKEVFEQEASEAGERPGQEADWLPLAYIRVREGEKGGQPVFAVSGEKDVRFPAFCQAWEQAYRHEAESNGIVDIRWRGLLKVLLSSLSSSSRPCETQPSPPRGPLPPHQQEPLPPLPRYGLSREQVLELIGEQIEGKREKYIRRGVTVISVPKRYRKGRTLYSEEIAHGFPGEEVFLWCGRVLEEKNYAYWSREKMRYSVLTGAEGLFPDSGDSGWKIDKQAVRQNVKDGTFQVALTLSKGRRRNRSREVAISWIAVKTI